MRGKVAKVVSERGRKGGEARMADAQRFFCHQCSLEIPRWGRKLLWRRLFLIDFYAYYPNIGTSYVAT